MKIIAESAIVSCMLMGTTLAGDGNVVVGNGNNVKGNHNKVNGDRNTQVGSHAQIKGQNNRIVGNGHRIFANNFHMFGPTSNPVFFNGKYPRNLPGQIAYSDHEDYNSQVYPFIAKKRIQPYLRQQDDCRQGNTRQCSRRTLARNKRTDQTRY